MVQTLDRATASSADEAHDHEGGDDERLRVYQLANRLGVSSKVILDALKDHGEQVKSVSSKVSLSATRLLRSAIVHGPTPSDTKLTEPDHPQLIPKNAVTAELPDFGRHGQPSIWSGVLPRNPAFTGREGLLARLAEALAGTPAAVGVLNSIGGAVAARPSVLPMALHGLGGVGKTQLAVEYVHRFTRDDDLVCWAPAYNALAARIQVDSQSWFGDNEDPDDRPAWRAVANVERDVHRRVAAADTRLQKASEPAGPTARPPNRGRRHDFDVSNLTRPVLRTVRTIFREDNFLLKLLQRLVDRLQSIKSAKCYALPPSPDEHVTPVAFAPERPIRGPSENSEDQAFLCPSPERFLRPT
jgi:hypothetical protein